uniref:Uveal autoantigen with coiled-coil domains and ankyrin repeats b n=1 Tax=Oryzias sinensis TaxID=183150 RepID=A0A8C7X1A1_9TELE
MKSLKYRLKRHEVTISNTDWNKYDDRLIKAVERGEVDKAAAVLSKKGIIPTKLDVEGRSAFHLAAARGHLECLNLLLGHNVDITASDATGKSALHLASRNGHFVCVQKLLQHNCPVGNVDLQGRTALHDAVMGGCCSSVTLLCDSGASVNASDIEGRTPLILATQMCHPRICQLLLERGADIKLRDKQDKTALILGCEFRCKDAVEVLLKSGADVKAVDSLGHDAFHYARLSQNPELTELVKNYLEKAIKGQTSLCQRLLDILDLTCLTLEAHVKHFQTQTLFSLNIPQDLERKNETLQEGLWKSQQEQKSLLDKVNSLQQQLTQVRLLAQTQKFLTFFLLQMLQKPAVSRPASKPLERSQAVGSWDLSEVDALRYELEKVRKRQQAAEEDTVRLQSALSRKSRECQELIQSRDAMQKQAEQQVQELEDALGDVQKRMLDSECKVKQLQAHVVAMKEHLGGQATEELRTQLQDVKAKYEGASAEVGRVRNRLKQSEKALEEYKGSESQLATELERLNQELGGVSAERDELAVAFLEMQNQLRDAHTKYANTVPAEKFDNMKNLLTNAVDEKERQLAELREDYDRVLEEVAELHRKLDSPASRGGSEVVTVEEHQRIRAALEEENATLKKKLMDVTAKSQILIQEVKDKDALRQQLEEVNSRMNHDFIPIKDHEEVQKNMVATLEDLKDQLVETSESCGKAEAQVQQLQNEKATLQKTISHLQSTSDRHQEEVEALRSENAQLTKKLDVVEKKCEDKDKECGQLAVQNQSLKKSMETQYVSREQHEKVKVELTSILESVKGEMLNLEAGKVESGEELKNVREEKEKLKDQLEKVMSDMKSNQDSIEEFRSATNRLNAAVVEAENRANEASAKYVLGQEEILKLTQELEAQKKELDTIQKAIQSKFIPLTAAEEKENFYTNKLKDLTEKLLEMEDKYNQEKSARERHAEEKEKLQAEMQSVQQRLDNALAASGKHKGEEDEFKTKYEELTEKWLSLEQQHKELAVQKAHLEAQCALSNTQIQNLQERLKSELTRIATYDTELKSLHDAMRQAQADCKKAREAEQEEGRRVSDLQKQLQELHKHQASLLQRHAEAKEALEAEVAKLQTALAEEEESSTQRAEDVTALQSELLQATQALEESRCKEEQMTQLKTKEQQLEEELANLNSKLLSLEKERQEANEEAAQAREGESRARTEMEAVQEKGRAVEKEIRELKERYDESLSTICDLQKRIETSAQQTEAKDKKITELLTDVERLKKALNGLSQLAYTSSSSPNKRQTQHADTLQAQIHSLQQQLADAERQHREVVSIYRTHLLSAAQGHMDEDVQAALLQIIRMRQEFVC